MPAQRIDLAGLTARIVGPDDAKLTVVLLHGFGAPGDDLVALAQYIDAPHARYVFPEAPLELGGMYGNARAWWLLDLARLEQELRAGVPRDRSSEIPDGLPAAREQMSRFLDQVSSRLGVDNKHLVLGGFSQGAMLSLDVALHRDTPPAGLILMSGTIVAESAWQPRMKQLAGVPVLQSHGRHDMLLPFAIAETLRDRMRAAGATVEWQPFVGGHEIPPIVLDAAGKLLRGLTTSP